MRISKLFFLAALICCSFTMSVNVATTDAQTTWTGAGGNDNWFTPGNWDTGVVPDGSTFDVIVDAPSPTNVNGTPTINSLQLGSNGIITIGFANLSFSGTAMTTLTNQGQINLTNGGGSMQLSRTVNNSGSISGIGNLLIQADGATLTGGGTITLNLPAISGVADSVLTIEDQTIEGQGRIGVDSIELINNGLIDANVSGGGTIFINPSVGGMVNTGTLQASGGGLLVIDGPDGDFDNTGGTIQALADSEVQLRFSPKITGGLLTTTGTGLLRVNSGPTLSDVTHSGNMEITGGSVLRMTNTFTNSGTISCTGRVHTESGDVTLTGGGTITMSDLGASGIGGNPGTILTIEDQTIEGRGFIGAFDIGIVNHGLIDANVTGPSIAINPSIDGVVNTSTMQASGGGTLFLSGQSGGIFDNNGGTIQALADSEVRHQNPDIVGGLLTSTGTGFHSIGSGTGSTVTDVTNTGHIDIFGNGGLNMVNTFTNSGTISCLGAVQTKSGDVTLTGGGTIMLDGFGTPRIGGNPGTVLTIEDQTIEGRGFIGNFQIGLINHGLIHANVSGQTLRINPTTGGLANTGTMQATAGGCLKIDVNSICTNEGTLLATTGGVLEFDDHVLNDGLIRVESDSVIDGAGVTNSGVIDLQSGGLFYASTNPGTVDNLIKGTGRIEGGNIQTRGIIAPGDTAGSVGTLTVGSNLQLFSEAVLEIQLASATQFDVLNVFNEQYLAGSIGIIQNSTLDVSLLGGFIPSASDQFKILDFTGHSPHGFGYEIKNPVNSGFVNATNNGTVLTSDGLGQFDVIYEVIDPPLGVPYVRGVTLSNFQLTGVLLGDVNLDTVVNLLDVAPFVDRISTGTFQAEADINGDGFVNLLDVGPFIVLLSGG